MREMLTHEVVHRYMQYTPAKRGCSRQSMAFSELQYPFTRYRGRAKPAGSPREAKPREEDVLNRVMLMMMPLIATNELYL